MGWTFLRKPDIGVKAFLDAEFTHESTANSYRVLRSAFVGLTYYAAVERISRENGQRIVFGAIVLTQYAPKARDGYTFGYKDMDETCGPCESKCPKTILALLTPTDSQYAIDWRKRCEAHHAARTAPVDDAKVAAWALQIRGARFDRMDPGTQRRWRNAYRQHHPQQEA